MNLLLDYAVEQTALFLNNAPKDIRKKKGQFFTSKETAFFMASLFNVSDENETISVLDPGSGTGILTAAFVDRIQKETNVKEISITCYETDEDVLCILEKILLYIKNNSTLKIEYHIIKNDYLLSQSDEYNGKNHLNTNPTKYDFVIGNPPYLKISKNSPIAAQMNKVVYGAPNLYFLFAEMSLFNLRDNGEMVYIIPRSWTSGLYFSAFRKHFLSNGKIKHVHLFVSRDKVFSHESVLQETIIIKVIKSSIVPDTIKITSSNTNFDFEKMTELDSPYDSIVVGDNNYVFLPTSKKEVVTLETVNRFNYTFKDIGLRMKTGIVVDFRQKEQLRKENSQNTVPLFYSQHIKNGEVLHYPSGKEYDWISINKKNLIQENKNYVFCKRFTAKEEQRRLQCGIYLESNFIEYSYIGTQNKINFVDDSNGKKLSIDEVFGIYTLLNSSIYDLYYRILNGSTQVNSTEINNIPVPSREVITRMGKLLRNEKILSTEICDEILNEVIYEQNW